MRIWDFGLANRSRWQPSQSLVRHVSQPSDSVTIKCPAFKDTLLLRGFYRDVSIRAIQSSLFRNRGRRCWAALPRWFPAFACARTPLVFSDTVALLGLYQPRVIHCKSRVDYRLNRRDTKELITGRFLSMVNQLNWTDFCMKHSCCVISAIVKMKNCKCFVSVSILNWAQNHKR